MACRRSVNKNNLLRWERVYGGLTIAELQAQGIAALCNPADVAPPFDLVATGGFDEIVLDWQYEGQNDGFIIYRSTDNVNFSILDAVTEAIRDYTDTTAITSVLYYYYIVATNGTFTSAPSNTASAESLNAFTFEVNTATAGGSGVGALRMALQDNVTNRLIDIYVDGVFLRKVVNDAGILLTSAELGAAELKEISLVGTMENWSVGYFGAGFSAYADRAKYTKIKRWGSFRCTTSSGWFYDCVNLVDLATDAPVTGVNTGEAFRGCVLVNSDISGWDTSTVNQMVSMYRGATIFNQDISGLDTSSVQLFDTMFFQASAFNQNLGAWNIASMTSGAAMFSTCGMSTANYTDTLVAWANQCFERGGTPTSVAFTSQTGRTFQNSRSGGANFATAGDARTYLATTLGWTISGDTVIA
jgi:surface protein